jgi:hypothetical protein
LKNTIKVKTSSNGNMHTFNRLLKADRRGRVSAVATSLTPSREIRSIVASTPKEAPLAIVTIVVIVVVVTVDIMADNQTLFVCH